MKYLSVLILIALIFIMLPGENTPEYDDLVEHRVSEGDTLWNYINHIDGRENFNGHQLIELVKEINNIPELYPGMVISIPKEVY